MLDLFWLARAKVVLQILERAQLKQTQSCVNRGVHVTVYVCIVMLI